MSQSNKKFPKTSGKNKTVCPEPETNFVVIEHKVQASQVIDNGDCTYTHISGDGVTTLINADPNFSLIDNCDGILTFAWKDQSPVVVDICKIIGDNCGATIVLNGDGTFTFTDNTGTSTTIAFPSSQFIDNGDGTIVHIGADGVSTTVNLCGLVAANCTDQLIDNLDGSFTHVAVDGTITNIPAPPVSSLVDNGNGTYTYDDGNGNITLIDVNEIDLDINSVIIAGSTITFTSEDGTSVVIDVCALVAANCNATLVENVDGSWTFTDNAGVVTTSSIPAESSLVDNLDGTATHVSGSGNITTLDICQMMIDGGCANTDSLVDNGNGTFTHTALDGTVTVVDMTTRPASTIADNGNGTFTHTSGDGVVTLLDVCQSIAANCNATLVPSPGATFTFTDNAGVSTVIGPFSSGTVATAVIAFTATNGAAVGVGDEYINFSDGTRWGHDIPPLQPIRTTTSGVGNQAIAVGATVGNIALTSPGGMPFFGLNQTPIATHNVFNPDPDRWAVARLFFRGTTTIIGGSDHWAVDVRGRHEVDIGDGILVVLVPQNIYTKPGNPGHPNPASSMGGSSRIEYLYNSAPIPPGGFITIRARSDLLIVPGAAQAAAASASILVADHRTTLDVIDIEVGNII